MNDHVSMANSLLSLGGVGGRESVGDELFNSSGKL
jgi:hypothetical protein